MIQIEQHGPVTCIRMARSFLGKPIYWTAAYWVDGLLIDSGPACAAPQLLKILRQAPVDQIVITHGHEDHIGGLAQICRAYPQAMVYAGPRTIPLLEDPVRLHMQLYRRLIWGVPPAVQGARSLDEVDNRIHTPHYRFSVVETPGHARDHVCYYEPNQRWVFCGDAFIGGHDRAWPNDSDLFATIGSLRVIAGLHPDRLFPGSGNVRRSAGVEILDKLNYLTRLTREVARLEASGLNDDEIVACLFKEEPSITFWSGGHFSALNLVKACRSYNALFAPIDAQEMATTASNTDGKNEKGGNSPQSKKSEPSPDSSAHPRHPDASASGQRPDSESDNAVGRQDPNKSEQKRNKRPKDAK